MERGEGPPEWVLDAVFYQIFPDRFRNGDPGNDPPGTRPWGGPPDRHCFFGGDLWGILEQLDYLEDLGVTALYLTPIFAAPTNHKYDTQDYFQVDPAFGGNGALRVLISALHSRGMRLVLDGVFNHCGEGHPFFQDALRRGRASPYWDWFSIWGEEVVREPEPNYACWAGVPSMPEWNHRNPEVREYLLSVVRHWLTEYEIDGWRLDTVEYLPPDFVRQVYRVAKEARPDAYILGEVMGMATSWFKHGALDGVMNYRLRDGLVAFFARSEWSAQEFAQHLYALRRSYPPASNFAQYNLVSSHDVPRFLTLCRGDRRRLILAYTFLCTYIGAPAIYYGDEVGLTGGGDPDCRRPFPWDESVWEREILSSLRELIRIRRASPALRRGGFRLLEARGELISFLRESRGEEALVALNLGEEKQAKLPAGGPWRDPLSGVRVSGSRLAVPACGFRLLQRAAGRA